MTTKSREHIYGSSIRASAERAATARKEADRLACEGWNQRMLGYRGPAQPSPALGDAQCRIPISRSQMPRPQYASNCATEHRPSLEDNAGLRAVTCDARIALRFVVIRSNAVIWSRFGPQKFRRATCRQRGGRASDSSNVHLNLRAGPMFSTALTHVALLSQLSLKLFHNCPKQTRGKRISNLPGQMPIASDLHFLPFDLVLRHEFGPSDIPTRWQPSCFIKIFR